MAKQELRTILGIDPGTNVMGFGIIRIDGKDPELVVLDVLKLKKTETHFERLSRIFECTTMLIEKYCPDEMAIESPFYGKNVQSMLKLGRAQGAAIAAALHKKIPVFEYAPRKIKLAITGVGSASKEQVARILQQIMHIETMPMKFDATDGLAVAVCHFFQKRSLPKSSIYSGWEDFIKNNPSRLK